MPIKGLNPNTQGYITRVINNPNSTISDLENLKRFDKKLSTQTLDLINDTIKKALFNIGGGQANLL